MYVPVAGMTIVMRGPPAAASSPAAAISDLEILETVDTDSSLLDALAHYRSHVTSCLANSEAVPGTTFTVAHPLTASFRAGAARDQAAQEYVR
jgi:hypothetical protein